MQTIIDNNQRKFLIQSQGLGNQKDIFCNLKDIPAILNTEFEKNEEFKIYEFWNRKLKLCSKKHINEMFKANQIDFVIGGKVYKFSFTGRKLGAIGICYKISHSVKSNSRKDAELKIYEKFDHITELQLKN